MTSMSGKVALVTGASSGIGRATAEVFAAKGAKVALAARREDELAGLVSEIHARGRMGPSSRHQSERHLSLHEV